MPQAKKEKWKDSRAKELLRIDIVEKRVTSDMKPKVVYAMRPEYQAFKKKNFSKNYRTLQKGIAKDQQRADVDHAAVARDLQLHPPATHHSRGYPRWAGSEAERLLQIDVENGIHTTLKPRELRATQEEYRAYPLDVFRMHIHQETRRRKERSYWLSRKRKKN